MKLIITTLAATAALAASTRAPFSNYTRDPSFPASPLPTGWSRVTAVAVGAFSDGHREVMLAQRNGTFPFFTSFSTAGVPLASWGGAPGVVSPHGIAVGPPLPSQPSQPSLWVADIEGFAVYQFPWGGGAPVATIGTPGKEGGGVNPLQLSAPAEVALTPFGVVISDGDGGKNMRVSSSSGSPHPVTAWVVGSNGTGAGQFQSPHSVCVDTWSGPAGFPYLWVADRGNKRLVALDAHTGSVLGTWGSECLGGGAGSGEAWAVGAGGGGVL